MRLNTSIRQQEAQALYRSLGFGFTAAHGALTPQMRAWLVFMSLDLPARAPVAQAHGGAAPRRVPARVAGPVTN
jgi:hypothetical protein